MSELETTDGNRRYVYQAELRFTYELSGATYFGSGHTVDFGRSSVCFATEDSPPDGTQVELRIPWPTRRNVCPRELIVRGRAVSTTERGTILATAHYEFRKRSGRPLDQAITGTGASSRA
jgi:hypothetical protein